MSGDPWLVIGLGNPGPQYEGTRHNIGAMVVEELARRQNVPFSSNKRGRADVVEGRLGPIGTAAPRVILAKPRSYMNESGGPTKALMDFYKVPARQLIVLHDELDIPLGAIRAKLGGGDNGHNGLKSVRSSTGGGEWFRIRLGIGRPPGRQSAADFVLKTFAGTERDEVALLIQRGADAVETLIADGLERTQNVYNS